jgi:hypothetical protein
MCFVSPVAWVYADDAPASNYQPQTRSNDQPTDQDDGPVKMGVPNDNLGKTTGDVCYTGHCSPWGSYLLRHKTGEFSQGLLDFCTARNKSPSLAKRDCCRVLFNRRPIF